MCGDHRCGVRYDLETIGRVALDHQLSVGASGIGLGLAHALAASRQAETNAAAEAPVGGPAACLAGSCSQATLRQVANAEQAMPVLHLDPEQIMADSGEARRAIAWAKDRLADGPVLIASSSTPEEVAALQSRHGRNAAGPCDRAGDGRCRRGSGAARRQAVGPSPAARPPRAVVDRLKIPAFPGWCRNRSRRARFARRRCKCRRDVLLALKSGNSAGRSSSPMRSS